jgi:hypothetical protein
VTAVYNLCLRKKHTASIKTNCISVLLSEVIGSVTVLGFEGSECIVQGFNALKTD